MNAKNLSDEKLSQLKVHALDVARSQMPIIGMDGEKREAFDLLEEAEKIYQWLIKE